MEPKHTISPGTLISVHTHRLGAQRQLAEVLEVIGGEGHRRYRVLWDDGHESIFFPGEDAVVERISRPAGAYRRKTTRS